MKRRPPIRANTADEAIEKMLEQKRISSKINYDVLKDLNIKPGASPSHKMETPKKEPRITGRNRKPAPTPLSLSMPLSSLGKRWVNRMLDTNYQERSGVKRILSSQQNLDYNMNQRSYIHISHFPLSVKAFLLQSVTA